MHKTNTAEIIRSSDGIVIVQILGYQELDDAKANIAAAIHATNGTPCPLMVDVRNGPSLKPDVRQFYGAYDLRELFTGLAMVFDASPLGRTIGNIYLRIARHRVPTRLFNNPESARTWLLNLS